MTRDEIIRMAREAYGDRYADALRAALAEPEITHAEGCWSRGPAHYECALAEIKRLNRQEMIRAKLDHLRKPQ